MKEKADITFVRSSDIVEKCSMIGEVSIDDKVCDKVVTGGSTTHSIVSSSTDTSTCSAVVARPSHNTPHTARSTRVAVMGKARSIDVNVSSLKSSSSVRCSLVSDDGGTVVQCEVVKIEDGKWYISFTPTHRGIYQIKLQDGDI